MQRGSGKRLKVLCQGGNRIRMLPRVTQPRKHCRPLKARCLGVLRRSPAQAGGGLSGRGADPQLPEGLHEATRNLCNTTILHIKYSLLQMHNNTVVEKSELTLINARKQHVVES
jgi:hypothetical protein